jgi:Zn-dependent M28 family amino/carboxypeptidase
MNMRHLKSIFPRFAGISCGLLAIFLTACVPAAAQLSTAEPDPLARIRDAAKSNVQACSATGETLCEQVAPRIIANALGDSPLADNLRRVRAELSGGASKSTAAARAVAWGVAAFQDAGVEVHTEKYTNPNESSSERENVAAEIRGREKPEEWVLVGAHLDPRVNGPGMLDYNCDAAMVIEAARDIVRTGIRPRRSIRFVLFTGGEHGIAGPWAYVRTHRAELDLARAAIIFRSGCSRMTGYSLNGRHDIEPGLREAMKPAESLGASNYNFEARMGTDNFDFLLEGVPTLTAKQMSPEGGHESVPAGVSPDTIDIADMKHNTAIVAVTAFGIAERAEPIGPRQSRSQIESLLNITGLELPMKSTNLWLLWKSGERGRIP